MKQVISLVVLMLVVIAGSSQATLKVSYAFANVEDGYDHSCKTEVLIDGELVGTSEVAKQTAGGTMQVKVPKGNHTLSVVNWTLYEGTWEPHTLENNYSIDATFTDERKFKKKAHLYLLFDLDRGTFSSWDKPVK